MGMGMGYPAPPVGPMGMGYPDPMMGSYPGAVQQTTSYGGMPGYGGYAQQTTVMTGYPQAWNRYSYNYSYPYSRRDQFILPIGVSPMVANLMMQGSQIFRAADTDWSGHLSKKEWKRAMRQLGIAFDKYQAKQLFYMCDTDRSGRISEREFVEFWVYFNNYRNPTMYPTIW